MTNDSINFKIGDYDYLKNKGREAWAWEYIRRNETYKKAWKDYLLRSCLRSYEGDLNYIDTQEMEEAKAFGLLFFC